MNFINTWTWNPILTLAINIQTSARARLDQFKLFRNYCRFTFSIKPAEVHFFKVPGSIYLFNFNNKNTRKRCSICLKSTIKNTRTTTMTSFCCFFVSFYMFFFLLLLHNVLLHIILLLTLNKQMLAGIKQILGILTSLSSCWTLFSQV